MTRILIVTEAGDAQPSGRIRALIYKDLFRADGIEIAYTSRQLPWLDKLMTPHTRWMDRLLRLGASPVVGQITRRLATIREDYIVRLARSFDIVYLQKTASWPLVAALRRASSARLVYDLNDAVWIPSRASFAAGGIREILRTVDAVTSDNPYGLEFARSFNESLFIVPDPPQVELFDQYRPLVTKSSSLVTLGWIGSPGTLFNLYSIWEPLEALFARHDEITLRLVGVGFNRQLLPRFEKVRVSVLPFYDQIEMVRELLCLDIGLFPLFDVDDSLARGVLKPTLYMSGEACVVARPIGQNRDLIADGQNGVFASTTGQWLDRLSQLVTDTDLRQRIARAGLETVREQFTLRHCYQQLRRALYGEPA